MCVLCVVVGLPATRQKRLGIAVMPEPRLAPFMLPVAAGGACVGLVVGSWVWNRPVPVLCTPRHALLAGMAWNVAWAAACCVVTLYVGLYEQGPLQHAVGCASMHSPCCAVCGGGSHQGGVCTLRRTLPYFTTRRPTCSRTPALQGCWGVSCHHPQSYAAAYTVGGPVKLTPGLRQLLSAFIPTAPMPRVLHVRGRAATQQQQSCCMRRVTTGVWSCVWSGCCCGWCAVCVVR
jgi:hypothetical protein